MLFFTRILAYSVLICLGGMTEWWQAAEHQLTAAAYENRISWATAENVRLVRGLPSFSYFKAHPFLPNPTSSAVTFLCTQSPMEYDQSACEVLLNLLENLRNVNSLALKSCAKFGRIRFSVQLPSNR
jgi:hypothetical protein